ncbi:MAG: peptidylprolyl isomerase [Phycisphaeraceae bacterium]
MKHGTRQMGVWLVAGVLAWPVASAMADDPGASDPGMLDAPQDEVVEEAAERAAAQVADEPAERDAYTMDGMIGQVNGRPIYARTVFEPIADQLRAIARQTSRAQFRNEAARLIAAQLDQIVTDALVLGAAERDLSEQERLGLRQMIQQRREELMRQHGQGSLALAEATLRRETGMGLDATLENFRQEVLIQRYLRRQLFPRINVTRRDIRRYYYDNLEQFNPQGQRVVELIRVRERAEADRIAAELEAGTEFARVAEDVRRLDAPGEAPLAHTSLNEVMAELAAGEHAGPVEAGEAFWFIRVAELDDAEQRSLRDAQLEIENRLRNQQFRLLSEQYRRDLFAEGSYNPIDQMTASLLEIAMSRYAPQ